MRIAALMRRLDEASAAGDCSVVLAICALVEQLNKPDIPQDKQDIR